MPAAVTDDPLFKVYKRTRWEINKHLQSAYKQTIQGVWEAKMPSRAFTLFHYDRFSRTMFSHAESFIIFLSPAAGSLPLRQSSTKPLPGNIMCWPRPRKKSWTSSIGTWGYQDAELAEVSHMTLGKWLDCWMDECGAVILRPNIPHSKNPRRYTLRGSGWTSGIRTTSSPDSVPPHRQAKKAGEYHLPACHPAVGQDPTEPIDPVGPPAILHPSENERSAHPHRAF